MDVRDPETGIPLRHASRLTLVAGLAVANVIRDMGLDARIKWPNDVRINGKKVCGILTEAKAEVDRVDYVILGIGINVNMELKDIPDSFRAGSTTLKVELGKHIRRVSFLQDFLFELEQQYIRFKTQPFSQILNGLARSFGYHRQGGEGNHPFQDYRRQSCWNYSGRSPYNQEG